MLILILISVIIIISAIILIIIILIIEIIILIIINSCLSVCLSIYSYHLVATLSGRPIAAGLRWRQEGASTSSGWSLDM